MNSIQHEEKMCNQIFQKELNNPNNKLFSSFWWEDYYFEIRDFIKKNVINDPGKEISIIEVGCGSGKSSILLSKYVESITLLDVSKNALEYAKLIGQKFDVENVTYTQQNMFSTKFKGDLFDLTWNIGTLEHYSDKEIIQVLTEMKRITKKGGYIAFGIPNKNSGPTIKAKFLTFPILKYLPGYKLDTERFFTDVEVLSLLEKVGIKKQQVTFTKFGNFLPMETPKWIIKLTKNKCFNYKFLNFYLIKL